MDRSSKERICIIYIVDFFSVCIVRFWTDVEWRHVKQNGEMTSAMGKSLSFNSERPWCSIICGHIAFNLPIHPIFDAYFFNITTYNVTTIVVLNLPRGKKNIWVISFTIFFFVAWRTENSDKKLLDFFLNFVNFKIDSSENVAWIYEWIYRWSDIIFLSRAYALVRIEMRLALQFYEYPFRNL